MITEQLKSTTMDLPKVDWQHKDCGLDFRIHL